MRAICGSPGGTSVSNYATTLALSVRQILQEVHYFLFTSCSMKMTDHGKATRIGPEMQSHLRVQINAYLWKN